MQTTYRFRLYPNKEQEEKLNKTLELCRFAYNKLLEKAQSQGRADWLALQNSLPLLKEQHPELNEAYSKMLQYEAYRLFANIKALAALKKNGRKIGKLRFKSRGSFKTFTYNQSGFAILKGTKRHAELQLSKIGRIRMRMHRAIEGNTKQLTVKRYPSGKWYAMVVAEQETQCKEPKNNVAVGIDLGVMNFIHDSNGASVAHPKLLNKSLSKLRCEQKKLCRKRKGSSNREKRKVKVARCHEKVLNQRNDFLHKLSRRYVNSYALIAVENLQVKKLISKSYNAMNLMDASWAKFLGMLEYKAERAGVRLVRVDAKYTTQKCSACGRIVIKTLSERIHKCSCGLEIDRDYNAARNILAKALGQELPDVMPVEAEPLHASASSAVEAGSPHL